MRAVQVVPDVPTFAVDDGFAYSIDDPRVGVGSVVRVPLGGRRVRGFVVGERPDSETSKLKRILSVVGDFRAFNGAELDVLAWVARYYVAPLSVVLRRAVPPNVAKTSSSVELDDLPSLADPLPKMTSAVAEGRRPRPRYLLGSGPWTEQIAGLSRPILDSGGSAMVVAPSVREAADLASGLGEVLGNRLLLATSALPAKDVTAAWVAAASRPGHVLVGTREIALWPMQRLGLVTVVEEGRRAMKATQTPTTHVRELITRRRMAEPFGLAFCGPVPTLETLAGGVLAIDPPRRVWPLVEIADRAEEPPGRGLFMDRTRQAALGVATRGGRVFVLVPRRGYAPAFRCLQCASIRRCTGCGARAAEAGACVRCGREVGSCSDCGGGRFEPLGAGIGRVVDDLARSGPGQVGKAGEGKAITVGTERDLVGLEDVDLAIAVDADGLMLAPHYRAGEDALRLLARLAGAVGAGRGKRCLVQTALPSHPVLAALRHGHPLEYLTELAEERAATGFPPSAELLAVEVTDAPDGADALLRSAVGAGSSVLGPALVRDRQRWLVQGESLEGARVRLRTLVHEWRDAGARVRVDVDPIDL